MKVTHNSLSLLKTVSTLIADMYLKCIHLLLLASVIADTDIYVPTLFVLLSNYKYTNSTTF